MKDDRTKKGEILLDAFGEIKDEFIMEAADSLESMQHDDADKVISIEDYKPKTEKKRAWIKYLSAAAVLILCVGVGSRLLPAMKMDMAPSTEDVNESSGEAVPADGEHKEASVDGAADISPELATEGPSDESPESVVESEAEKEYSDTDIATEPAMPNAQGEAFVLTAGLWNDNENWPFFTNLVNSGLIEFPSFGIDPRNRVKVTLTNESGELLSNEQVNLCDEEGNILWTARTNKSGVAYLFYEEGQAPAYVEGYESIAYLSGAEPNDEGNQQGEPVATANPEDVSLVMNGSADSMAGVQVMFIVDTTGSMGDELSYLQMDFAQIARDTAGDGVTYSVNFYRDAGDEYVTKTNPFTDNVDEVQKLINNEYAYGGGDTPEAVSEILQETITKNGEWRNDRNKVCFLIFDAPPHYGTEQGIIDAVKAAAQNGIHIVPVVASNAERETELFGRALAICTDGDYVFLTDHSGVGGSHLEPIIGDYEVELLHDIIVRIINKYK